MAGEPLAYLNGEFVPHSQAALPVYDLGLHGVAVTEMTRTFGGACFRLGDHLARLQRSLDYVGFECPVSGDELAEISEKLVEHNFGLLPPSHDLGLIHFVTAGLNRSYVGQAAPAPGTRPTVCVHTFPLAFELWADKYAFGQHLVTVLDVPAIDPTVKTRSRLHWYLADRQARARDAGASALLAGADGNITETSSENFFVVNDGALITPPVQRRLAGVSLQVIMELAADLGMEAAERDLSIEEALAADEAFTTSTPYCLLPVTQINGQPIGDGEPGPVFARLMRAWNELAGLDIVECAQRAARDRESC